MNDDQPINNSTTVRCPVCNGTGVTGITVADYYSGGPEQLTTCYSCGGDGELPDRLAKLRAWHLTASSHVADEIDFDESRHRQWKAAKLMLAYWSDRDDEPSPRDMELIAQIDGVLSGSIVMGTPSR